jgi:glycosyltransferase involved in cell wall biosynthesis
MHVDQRWVDFAPAFHDDVAILRDPGCNVAYWNLHERTVRVDGDDVTVNGRPGRFFHFSGFDPADLSVVSRHQSRFSMDAVGEAATLFHRYSRLVLANGHAETRTWPYAYGRFGNGVAIPDMARRIYRELGEDAHRFGDPFDAERSPSFYQWLRTGVDRRQGAGTVSRLWYEIYHQEPSLQLLFPDVLGRHRASFIGWIFEHGFRDHRVDPALLPENIEAPPTGSPTLPGRLKTAIRRAEPAAKRWVKRKLQAQPRLLRAVKRVHDELKHRRPMPVIPPVRPEAAAASGPRVAERLGVNVAGYFDSEKGVGEAARASVRALRAAGLPVELNNVVDESSENCESAGWRVSEDNPHPVNLIHVNADQVPAFARSRGGRYLDGRVNVGFWFWELSVFPDEWRSSFEGFDEIWVATAFTQDAVSRAAPVPVVRMPVAIEPKPAIPPRRDRSRFGLSEETFVFLFVFDFHSYMERKNPLGLLEAFRLAFGDRDDVALVLKTAHPVDLDTGAEITQVHEAAARAKNVTVINTVLARTELDALLGTADCYVALHRSEGFGLPIAESMSRGTPVIATAYSGNMDFMTPANSLLVKYHLVELERDHGPYRKGNVWADPDPEHAAELMRWVVEHPEAAREVGRRGREHIERFHDARRVGELMRDRLRLVHVERRGR